MPQILDPTNTADNDAFDGIRDLGHTAATSADIVKNPLYLAAEDYIVGRYASATDRNDAERDQVVLALQFLTAAYLLQGGGATASNTSATTTGIVNSQTILGQTVRYASGGTTHGVRVSHLDINDRYKFLEGRAVAIMDEVTGEQTITPTDGSIVVKGGTTKSKEIEFTYDLPQFQ